MENDPTRGPPPSGYPPYPPDFRHFPPPPPPHLNRYPGPPPGDNFPPHPYGPNGYYYGENGANLYYRPRTHGPPPQQWGPPPPHGVNFGGPPPNYAPQDRDVDQPSFVTPEPRLEPTQAPAPAVGDPAWLEEWLERRHIQSITSQPEEQSSKKTQTVSAFAGCF